LQGLGSEIGTLRWRRCLFCGFRRVAKVSEEETSKMPILTTILDHDILDPLFQKGKQEGAGARLIENRFGSLPLWANEKLLMLPASELEDLSVRILDAPSLEELLPRVQEESTES
jgi:hypothetical protein